METSRSKDLCQDTGPYRATKLWNNAVYQFRKNLPVGRHRRNMRVFEDCFVASDAVDWLHDYLLTNQHFGDNVTRFQTVQLLQKFEKAKVFEEVRNLKQKELFQDNGRLYKFLHVLSPKKRTPLKNRTNNKSDLENGKITPQKLDFTVEQAKKLPKCQPLHRTLKDDQVEKVWKTVTLARLQKLLGKISVHDVLDLHDIHAKFIMHNIQHVGKNGMVSNINKEDQLPHWVISAMRCLAHWPEPVEENLPSYPGFERDVFRVVKDYFVNLDEPLLTFELYDVFCNIFVHADHPSPWRSTPRPSCLMSDDSFLSVENLLSSMASPRPLRAPLASLDLSTITNIDGFGFIDQSFSGQLNKSAPNLHETLYITANDISCFDNFAFEGSDRSGNHLPRVRSSGNINDAETFLRVGQDNIKRERQSFKQAHTHRYEVDRIELCSTGADPPKYIEPPPYRGLHRTFSAASDKLNDVLRGPVTRSRARSRSYNESVNVKVEAEQPVVSASQSAEHMKDLLQICCLFVPPANRRKLHLLMRLMWKMAQNDQLSLGDGVSMRSLVLQTFYRCVVMCIDESCYDDQLGVQLVSFLMDHHEAILSVPQRLKQNIDCRITEMQRIQIRYDPSSPTEQTYCERISVQQYEQQKLTNSEEALYDLLGTIAQSDKMSAKEKRRRLKEFQKEYPSIYQRRFPSRDDDVIARPRYKPLPLLNGMSGALTKLKAMRF